MYYFKSIIQYMIMSLEKKNKYLLSVLKHLFIHHVQCIVGQNIAYSIISIDNKRDLKCLSIMETNIFSLSIAPYTSEEKKLFVITEIFINNENGC